MQAAEMLCGIRPVYHLVFIIALSIAYVHTFPLQVLPSIPGYIPVYIRHGDQPLEEINPALAEAFHEGSSLSKNIHLDNIPGPVDFESEEDEANRNNIDLVHIRQTDENFSGKDEKSNGSTDKTVEPPASKLVADNADKGSESFMRETAPAPVVEVSPLASEEKGALEKLQIQIEDETNHPKDAHNANLNLSDVSDTLYAKNSEEAPNPVMKVDQIIIDETTQPDLHLTADVHQLDMHENIPVSAITDEELPIKEQGLASAPSNVKKISPSSETVHQLEKERTENQSLEDKSK